MRTSLVSRRVGSGFVVVLGTVCLAIALLAFGRIVGWEPTWGAFGVTPLLPPFFDMHVINDYAACALKGADAYAPHACNVDNFNIPPTWLWLGSLGVDGSDSSWLSATLIAADLIVMVLLFRGRSWPYGVIALGAMISPSVMMGVERGNLDLLILALIGSAALIYEESRASRACAALFLLCVGVTLKLFPLFCVSIAVRFNRCAFSFACALAALSLLYFDLTLNYILQIRQNVPTTFVLSYGYKTIFLGIDHIRTEAGLGPIGLANTWVPAFSAALVLICAATVAVRVSNSRDFVSVSGSTAGTAFLFGAGIYCGTYLLGTNFIYRLMFLLLCVPQLQDWQIRWSEDDKAGHHAELGLFGTIFGVLWLNGNSNGHSTFLLLPQLLNWFLFFFLATVLMANILRTSPISAHRRQE